MYLDRSKMLSFFFFSLSCGGSRAREAGRAASSAAPAGPRGPPPPRSPPSCRAAPLGGGAAPGPCDPAPHASAAPAVRLRGAARRGVAGKHLATPVAGTRQHGGGGGGAGAARGGRPPPRGPGEGCARPAGPAGCGDPASRYPAARSPRPARPGLGARPRAGGCWARSRAVTLRACRWPAPSSSSKALCFVAQFRARLKFGGPPPALRPRGSASGSPAAARDALSARPGGCPAPASVSPSARGPRPPSWLW